MFGNDDNKLKKNHDPKQIGHILLSAKERQVPIYAWRIIGDKKIMAQVHLDAVLTARGEVRVSPLPKNVEAFAHVVGGCDQVNFFLPQSSLLFQAQIKGQHGLNGLNMAFPQFVAHMERRVFLRLNSEGSSKLRVQFIKTTTVPRTMNQFFGKAIQDIGAGGLSFLVSKQELRFLISGEEIKSIELIIDGDKIKTNAKILRTQELGRHSYPSHSSKVYRVSLEFKGLDKKDQERLATYVFRNLKLTQEAV